jgi:hypothetical protein
VDALGGDGDGLGKLDQVGLQSCVHLDAAFQV